MRGIGERSLSRNSRSSSARLDKRRLSRVLEGFILKCKLEDLKPQTIETHRLKLGRFVDYCSDCPLGDVSPVIIREFLGYVKDKYGLDIITVQRHLVSLKVFFHWMCEEGFVISNPIVGVRVGRIVKKVVREPYQSKNLRGC